MRELVGYYTYYVPVEMRTQLINVSLNYGIEPCHVRENSQEIVFRITATRARYADDVFAHTKIPYKKSELSGAMGIMKHLAKSPGVIVGVLVSLLIYIWLSGVVWEVKITASGDIDEDRVLKTLSECGLYEGQRLSRLDVDELVNEYLLRDPETAFAAVHINGVIAEVELIPNEIKEEPEPLGTPCNIVASVDALITDMTVYAGKPLVKVGETVRAGDIIVSGIITDVGGTRFVCAAADVYGQQIKDVEAVAPVEATVTHVAETDTTGLSLEIFSKTFSIGESGETTIAEQKQIYLFGAIRLPIRVTWYKTLILEESTEKITDEQRMRLAEEKLSQEIADAVADGNLLSLKKEVFEDEAGTKITAHIVFESNIGKSLAFDVENN